MSQLYRLLSYINPLNNMKNKKNERRLLLLYTFFIFYGNIILFVCLEINYRVGIDDVTILQRLYHYMLFFILHIKFTQLCIE